MFIATLDCYIAWSQFFPTARALIGNFQVSWNQTMKLSTLHLVKISGIFGSAVNGTRFVGSSHWKIPRKSGKSKKVVPFSWLEFPNGMSCSIYVSRRLYQFQVHGQAQRRPGVYDQMEQLFTNRKLNLGFHRNFRVFLTEWKAPTVSRQNLWSGNIAKSMTAVTARFIEFPASKFPGLYSGNVDILEKQN